MAEQATAFWWQETGLALREEQVSAKEAELETQQGSLAALQALLQVSLSSAEKF